MAQNYETVLIMDPNLSEDQVKEYTEQFSKEITERGGNVLQTQNWGKRRLEYSIQKKTHAIYTIIYFELDNGGNLVEEFERTVRISDDLLRELTVKVPGLHVCNAPSDTPFADLQRQRRPMSRGPRRSGPPFGGPRRDSSGYGNRPSSPSSARPSSPSSARPSAPPSARPSAPPSARPSAPASSPAEAAPATPAAPAAPAAE